MTRDIKHLSINFEHAGAVAWITIDRPTSANALSLSMWAALGQMIQQAQTARAIVITGSGATFCAGADLHEIRQLKSGQEAGILWNTIHSTFRAIVESKVPTIAKITGACLGGGCLLAACCDFRIACEDSLFGIPVARLGIILDDMTIWRLCAIIGETRAKELLITGRILRGDQAYAIGLINEIAAKEDHDKLVEDWLDKICANSALSISTTKESLLRLEAGLRPHMDPERNQKIIDAYISEEVRRRLKSTQVER